MSFWDDFFWAVKSFYEDLRTKHDKWAVLLFALLALVLYWVFYSLERSLTAS